MSDLLRFDLAEHSSIMVEVEADEPGIARASRVGNLITSTAESFEAALDHVRRAADAALSGFRSMEARPDEVQIQFGVRLNAEAGAVIAKTSADGHLQVSLTWRREVAPAEPPAQAPAEPPAEPDSRGFDDPRPAN
ncbi:CU044_2847 family protein [Streptomyces syringium]|uniref:CU044_2847 family protein n=1 Tax=Streptomyces syringium TaxID=76729 RepID=UPI0034283691